MNKDNLLKKLKESTITIGDYIPSKEVKSMSNVIITLNNEPLLGLGSSSDSKTLIEAKKLIESAKFLELVDKSLSNESLDTFLEVQYIQGNNIKWEEKEICIAESEFGKTENGNEVGNLIWIVFGKRALEFATLLCITKEIECIANPKINM